MLLNIKHVVYSKKADTEAVTTLNKSPSLKELTLESLNICLILGYTKYSIVRCHNIVIFTDIITYLIIFITYLVT